MTLWPSSAAARKGEWVCMEIEDIGGLPEGLGLDEWVVRSIRPATQEEAAEYEADYLARVAARLAPMS